MRAIGTRANRRALAALALAALLPLQACEGEPGQGGDGADVSGETLASLIADDEEATVVSQALGDAGLAQVFDGAATYTILLPRDAAFEALGEAGESLRTAEQRPALIAILRHHIVPGYLTPEDIGKAIALADDGSVEMRTMAHGRLTFTGEGDTIVVTSEDGTQASFAGEALRASNGVAIPVDALLESPEAASPQG